MPDGEETRQIRHPIALVTSIGLFAAFVGVSAWTAATRIEDRLGRHARSALADAGIAASVQLTGRDVTLAGTVESQQESTRAAILISDLRGVRRVRSSLAVALPPPTVRPTPEPADDETPTGGQKPRPAPTGDIGFDVDATEPRRAADGYIRAVAEYLKEYSQASATIEGHSDNIGDRPLNQELSEARARTVAERLVRLGVDGTRLRTRGYADARPVASNRDAAGRAANRRVEIVVEATQ